MDLVRIYACLCDRTRLRILHLLLRAPLCVCQIQAALQEPQVKVSKHLAYLKRHGLVESSRSANWIEYRLPAQRSAALQANLACLQDCVQDDRGFRRDVARLEKIGTDPARCCRPAPARRASSSGSRAGRR